MQPGWSDVAADLAAARDQAARAAAKARTLASLSGDSREDRELAIGKHVHDPVSALERAIERLVLEFDGALPHGRAYHQDLLDRAARPLPGTRPALLTARTRRALGLLIAFRHAFHHAYGGFDFALAQPDIALAEAAIPAAADELEAAAAALGFRPEPPP